MTEDSMFKGQNREKWSDKERRLWMKKKGLQKKKMIDAPCGTNIKAVVE